MNLLFQTLSFIMENSRSSYAIEIYWGTYKYMHLGTRHLQTNEDHLVQALKLSKKAFRYTLIK